MSANLELTNSNSNLGESVKKAPHMGLKFYTLLAFSSTGQIIGQKAAEKRGIGWALTTFLREAWGLTKACAVRPYC